MLGGSGRGGQTWRSALTCRQIRVESDKNLIFDAVLGVGFSGLTCDAARLCSSSPCPARGPRAATTMTKTTLATLLLLGLLVPPRADSVGPESQPARVGAVEQVEQALLASRHTARLAPDVRRALAATLVREARANDLEWSLVLAVIQVESTFNPRALSPAGAYGLMQIMPRTGLAYARKLGIPWRGPEHTLFDPVLNVRIGIRYLATLRDRFGNIPTALSAYNQGPTRVSRRLRARERVPAGYAERVMNAWAGGPIALGS